MYFVVVGKEPHYQDWDDWGRIWWSEQGIFWSLDAQRSSRLNGLQCHASRPCDSCSRRLSPARFYLAQRTLPLLFGPDEGGSSSGNSDFPDLFYPSTRMCKTTQSALKLGDRCSLRCPALLLQTASQQLRVSKEACGLYLLFYHCWRDFSGMHSELNLPLWTDGRILRMFCSMAVTSGSDQWPLVRTANCFACSGSHLFSSHSHRTWRDTCWALVLSCLQYMYWKLFDVQTILLKIILPVLSNIVCFCYGTVGIKSLATTISLHQLLQKITHL